MAGLCADCILWAPSPVLCFHPIRPDMPGFTQISLCLTSSAWVLFLATCLDTPVSPEWRDRLLLASGANPTHTSWSDKVGCIAHWTTNSRGTTGIQHKIQKLHHVVWDLFLSLPLFISYTGFLKRRQDGHQQCQIHLPPPQQPPWKVQIFSNGPWN